MNKRYLPDIHGAYQRYNKQKKQMSKEAIKQELIAKGLSEDKINDIESQAYASQYAFGYKKYNDFLIDLDNTVTILTGANYSVARGGKQEVQNIDNVLKNMGPIVSEITDHLKKKQTGSELIQNALDVNFKFSNNPMRMSSSMASLIENAKKFNANEEFFYFDTETFSGKNLYGEQTLLGMQEFSGRRYKRVNGKIEEVAGSKIEALFGLDKTSTADLHKINIINEWIEHYETTGQMPGHSLAEVTLKRLAVQGHSNTQLHFGDDGLVTISKYASPQDMKGKELSPKLIRRGLEKELAIGAHQKKVGRVGIEELGSESISASTFSFFRYINELNTTFSMSKNGITFDSKVISQEAEARYNNLTNKQKTYLTKYFGTQDFHKLTFAQGHLDQEYLFREAMAMKGEAHYVDPSRIEYIQKLGLTTGQQEGLARAINEQAIYNSGKAAHTAGQDTFAGAYLAAGEYRDGKSLMETMIDDLIAEYNDGLSVEMSNNVIKTKSGEALTPIFIATKTDQFDSSSLDFAVDEFTGDIHFGNKRVMGKDGNIRDAVFAPSTKKNVPYEIKVNKFTPNDDVKKMLNEVGDQFKGTDDLYVVSFIPQLDKQLAGENSELITTVHRLVQGVNKVESLVSNNLVYAFNKDAEGNYRELSTDDGVTQAAINAAREKLSVHTTENGQRIVKETTATEKITKGTFDLINDSAAREMRNTDLKKAQAFINVRNSFNQLGYSTDKEIKDRIGSLISYSVAQGKGLSLDVQDDLELSYLLSMVGYSDKATGNTVLHPGTFKNFYNTFDAFSSMGDTLDTIVDLSKKGGLDADLRYKEYIKNLRKNIADSIVNDEEIQKQFIDFMGGKGLGKTSEEIVNGLSTVENYAFDNKFEFNIAAKNFKFYNKNTPDPEDIFTVDLAQGKHYSLINNLLNRNYGAENVKKMNAASREVHAKKALMSFIETINDSEEYKGIFNKLDGIKNIKEKTKINYSRNSVSLAADVQRIIRQFKEDNPMAGSPSKTTLMNIIEDQDLIAFAKSINEGQSIIDNSLNESTRFLRNKKSKVITKKNVEKEASNIVDTVLNNITINNKKVKDINKIAAHASKVYGYDQKNIALRLRHNREEQINMVTSIINAVHSIEGGSVVFNKNQIGIKIGNSDIVDVTKYLPVVNFNNGILSNTLNNSTIAAGEMISVKDLIDHNGNLTRNENAIRSTLARGSRDIKYLENIIKNKDTDNAKIDTILYSLKQMNANLRETSQVSIGNTFTEAIGSVRRLDMRELQLAIPALMNDIEKSDKFTEQQKKVLRNNIKRFSKLDSDAEYDQIAAEIEPLIARLILGASLDEKLNDNIDSHYFLKRYNLFVRDTSYSKLERASGENDISAFQQLSNYKKPPIHQRRNAKLYRKSDMEDFIESNKDNDNTFNSIFTSNRIVTNKEQKLSNRQLSDIIDSTDSIMATRLDIDDKTFKERLFKFKQELKDKGELTERKIKEFSIASSMNLFEQEKIVSSRVAEQLFNDNDTQFISVTSGIVNTLLNKERDVEIANSLFEKQSKTIPVITVDKDGKITFKYGNKQLVSKHETLFTKEGFGSVTDTVGANFDGLLGFRYYSANVALNEGEIEKLLNESGVKSEAEAFEFLNTRFKGMFAVENAVAKGMNKMYVDVEKGMGRSLAVGAGSLDSNIAMVLKDVGLGDTINSLVKEEYLSVAFNNIDNADEVLSKYGFNSRKEFFKAIQEERHSVNDLVQAVFGNKGIAVFTNDAKIKHESVDMAVSNLINTAALKKVSETNDFSQESWNKVYGEIFDVLKNSKAFAPFIDRFDSETGQIITKQVDDMGYNLKLEDVKTVAEQLGMVDSKGNVRFGIDNEYGGQLVQSSFTVAGPGEYAGTSGSQGRLKTINAEIEELRSVSDLSPQDNERLQALIRERNNAMSRNKLLTVDLRTARTLDRQSYNVTNKLNVLHSSLSAEALGGKDMFNEFFGDITEINETGDVVLKEGVDHRTNALLLDELKSKALYDENLEYLGGGFKKLDASYVDGLSAGDERNIIYQKYKDKNISRQYAELSHSYTQSISALEFNGGSKKITEDDLKAAGFSEIDIQDIIRPTGSGSADFIGQDGVAQGKSFLLNIYDKEGNASKIAVPYMPAKQVGDELVNTDLNKAIGSVANAYERLSEFRAGNLNNTPNNLTEEQLESYLTESVEDLRQAIKVSAQDVERDLNSVKLDSYKYNKASGMLYHKGNKALNSDFYNTATFSGMTLGELAEKDVFISAATTGIDFFRERGLLEESYYKQFGYTTEEQMIEHLQTKGVVGLLGRSPQTEDMSTSLSMIYLSKDKNIQEIRVTAEAVLAKNGDFDGDNFALTLIEGNSESQKYFEMQKSILADTVQLRAVRQRLIEDSGTGDNLTKGKITKEAEEARATFDQIFNKSATGSSKDTIINMIDNNITTEQVNEYKEITSGLINSIGRDTYRQYDFDQSFDALMNEAANTYDVGSTEYNKALEAINFSMAETKQVMANISNSAKKDIGYMDTPLTELENMADALQLSADESKYIASVSKVMKEAPISKKHDASAELSITNRYREAWKNAMTLGDQQAAQEVIDIMSQHKEGIVEQALTTDLAYSGLESMSVDDAFEQMMTPVRKILDLGTTFEGQQAYASQKKINEINAGAHRQQIRTSIFGEAMAELTEQQFVDEDTLRNSTAPLMNEYGARRSIAKDITEEIAHGIKAVSGSGLAKAALGIAGAIMAIGYIGGNPSVAPGMEAQQMDEYESLQDEDLSINKLPGGAGQGYVININATSNAGQEHAINAIQKAMHSSVPTDINIAMNMTDKTSNINSRYIENLLLGAL